MNVFERDKTLCEALVSLRPMRDVDIAEYMGITIEVVEKLLEALMDDGKRIITFGQNGFCFYHLQEVGKMLLYHEGQPSAYHRNAVNPNTFDKVTVTSS